MSTYVSLVGLYPTPGCQGDGEGEYLTFSRVYYEGGICVQSRRGKLMVGVEC